MKETFEDPGVPKEKRTISPLTLAIAAIAMLAIAGTLWFMFAPAPGGHQSGGATVNLKMNAVEQEYAKKIEIGNIEMSRAENFLHQEVTTIGGEVYNGGSEAVSGLQLTMEFYDEMNQVVLRETRPAFGAPEKPLAAGERREFEISFEHLPAWWNMQQPAMRVSYLQLAAHK